LARLEISTNSRNQNFATRVMSNGVEVIVAGMCYLTCGYFMYFEDGVVYIADNKMRNNTE